MSSASDHFGSAGHNMSSGWMACQIISSWTWVSCMRERSWAQTLLTYPIIRPPRCFNRPTYPSNLEFLGPYGELPTNEAQSSIPSALRPLSPFSTSSRPPSILALSRPIVSALVRNPRPWQVRLGRHHPDPPLCGAGGPGQAQVSAAGARRFAFCVNVRACVCVCV